MGCFDVYCCRCGLPIRRIEDKNKVLSENIQKILDKGILVVNGKYILVKNYDDYGRCEDSSGNIVDVGYYLYSSSDKVLLYHVGCFRYNLLINNKNIVEKEYQKQMFDDEEYVKYISKLSNGTHSTGAFT
jgi:hypothetical protein